MVSHTPAAFNGLAQTGAQAASRALCDVILAGFPRGSRMGLTGCEDVLHDRCGLNGHATNEGKVDDRFSSLNGARGDTAEEQDLDWIDGV